MSLLKGSYPLNDYPQVNDAVFPANIKVSFVVCSKNCGSYGFAVHHAAPVCEYCGHIMKAIKTREYSFVRKDAY